MSEFNEFCRRLLRKIYRGLGITAVSFAVQACNGTPGSYIIIDDVTPVEYGMPPSLEDDFLIRGSVQSKKTNAQIPGIKVSVNDSIFDYTNSDGSFSIYAPKQESYTITFEDIDGKENGGPYKKHSMNITAIKDEASLNVDLEEDD